MSKNDHLPSISIDLHRAFRKVTMAAPIFIFPDELASVLAAMGLVEENARRYWMRITKFLIGNALMPRLDMLDEMFTFLEVDKVN